MDAKKDEAISGAAHCFFFWENKKKITHALVRRIISALFSVLNFSCFIFSGQRTTTRNQQFGRRISNFDDPIGESRCLQGGAFAEAMRGAGMSKFGNCIREPR